MSEGVVPGTAEAGGQEMGWERLVCWPRVGGGTGAPRVQWMDSFPLALELSSGRGQDSSTDDHVPSLGCVES